MIAKPALRALYLEYYQKYRDCLDRCPSEGKVLEIGSGEGFVKELIPEVITSDVLDHSEVDQKIDAQKLPFENSSLRAIFLLNSFHHIPDVGCFFRESLRTLMSGGRILIIDPFPGWISTPILKYAHFEGFSQNKKDWKFESEDPLKDANNALAWMVFVRDRERFEREFPDLRIEGIQPHTPLRYWLSGGQKSWSLLPSPIFRGATRLDQWLCRISSKFGSFVDIEIKRK